MDNFARISNFEACIRNLSGVEVGNIGGNGLTGNLGEVACSGGVKKHPLVFPH